MLIGYGKLGRSSPLTLKKCGTVGGDVEFSAVIKKLAQRRPNDDFVLIGRNSGEDPKDVDLPSNIINPWSVWNDDLRIWKKAQGITDPLSIEGGLRMVNWYKGNISPVMKKLDHMVMWIGQHGSSNSPKPKVSDPSQLTHPHDWELKYCAYLLEGINDWRDQDPMKYEEINLNADARNYHKMRDLRWPLRYPVITQYNMHSNIHHSRFDSIPQEWLRYTTPGPNNMWDSRVEHNYKRLEICGLVSGTVFGNLIKFNNDWNDRYHFGLFINEAGGNNRYIAMRDYVMPLEPAFIHGKWNERTQIKLNTHIDAVPWEKYFPNLHSVHSTFTTPSSGSGWATTKPWEAFAAGTVCFFHPNYDTQNHILEDAHKDLNYLRIKNPKDLKQKVMEMNNDREKWEHIVDKQKQHFDNAIKELQYMKAIEKRLI